MELSKFQYNGRFARLEQAHSNLKAELEFPKFHNFLVFKWSE